MCVNDVRRLVYIADQRETKMSIGYVVFVLPFQRVPGLCGRGVIIVLLSNADCHTCTVSLPPFCKISSAGTHSELDNDSLDAF